MPFFIPEILTQFYVKHYFEGVFPQKEGINMRFSRKLLVRKGTQNGTYGSLSIPKCVLDMWASVENVEMCFDESRNILVISPIGIKPIFRDDQR